MRFNAAGARCLHTLLSGRSPAYPGGRARAPRLQEHPSLQPAQPGWPRKRLRCARAVADIEAPPAQDEGGTGRENSGLQLEVNFEEPRSKIPVTRINTKARVISSASGRFAPLLSSAGTCTAIAMRALPALSHHAPQGAPHMATHTAQVAHMYALFQCPKAMHLTVVAIMAAVRRPSWALQAPGFSECPPAISSCNVQCVLCV